MWGKTGLKSEITLTEGWGVFSCRYSERSNTKCVGITIETRPDYCLKRHLSDMLNYGCTRLEIGVQSVYEDVARDTNRYELGGWMNEMEGWKLSGCRLWHLVSTEATRWEPCASLSTSQRTPGSKWSPTWCPTCQMWAWRGTWSSLL